MCGDSLIDTRATKLEDNKHVFRGVYSSYKMPPHFVWRTKMAPHISMALVVDFVVALVVWSHKMAR